MLSTAGSALLQQHCNMAAPEVEQAGREGGGGAVEGRGSEWTQWSSVTAVSEWFSGCTTLGIPGTPYVNP